MFSKEEVRISSAEAELELSIERAAEGLTHLELEPEDDASALRESPFQRLMILYELGAEDDDAHFHLQFGRQFIQVSLFELAIMCLARAVDFAPRWADAHYYLGHALWKLGRAREAARSFGKARRLDPTLFEARYSDELLKLEPAGRRGPHL